MTLAVKGEMFIYAPLNTEAIPVLQRIEVATFFQLPSFHLVGLPGPEVAESKERVRAAIESSQLSFPKGRVVVNLSPADIKKRGTGLDLGVALAVLSASLCADSPEIRLGAWAELGLDGSVKPAGQITRTLYAAWKGRLKALVVCESELSEAEAALQCLHKSREMEGPAPGLIPVMNLRDAWQILSNWKQNPTPWPRSSQDVAALVEPGVLRAQESDEVADLLPLSPAIERILGVIVSGKHHFLVLGPKGVGKSHLVEWLICLQPPLSPQDDLKQRLLRELADASSGHSLGRSELGGGRVASVPVRWVSSQVRPSALIGGWSGGLIRPGEYSLAHGGLLIADEFPEWGRDSRESLREPLERKKVSVTRAQGAFELPTDFQFIATGNLCPCGGWPAQLGGGSSLESDATARGAPRCRCAFGVSRSYLSKLSGPVLDRIDCVVLWRGSHPSAEMGLAPEDGSRSRAMSERVQVLRERLDETRARAIQNFGQFPGLLKGAEVESILQKRCAESWSQFVHLHPELIATGSHRARHKMARIAFSLSAWDREPSPTLSHWIEASYYRPEKLASFNELS